MEKLLGGKGSDFSHAEWVLQSKEHFRDFHLLRDEQMAATFQKMKEAVEGSSPGTSSPQLYGLVMEAVRRKTGLTLFDSQLQAARVMELGHIAELPTGEGKTLAAVVTACAQVGAGGNVHILVFNDYLARRDWEHNRQIFQLLGISSACITETAAKAKRRTAYEADVLYISAKEAGFDLLRNFHAMELYDHLEQRLHSAIVDEADSILIDEACTPLVLAAKAQDGGGRSKEIWRVIEELDEGDVEVERGSACVSLKEEAVSAVERALQVENLFTEENSGLYSLVQAALEARFLLERDVDYFIKDKKVQIVDQATGRTAIGRKFPDLQQQAVEWKEGALGGEDTVICNSITMQFFLKGYPRLCGMTGTAKTSEGEIWDMYGLKVDVIRPHVPCVRIDHPDVILLSEEEKKQAVIRQIKDCWKKKQPVLLAASDLRECERYSRVLEEAQLPHWVLNARNDREEALLIAAAGQSGRITVSTNMAGRGVDIRLGGESEEDRQRVRLAGGLFIIGTYLNKSRRLDNQLRGRAGRQGDPGESRFFLSLDEPCVVQHLQERGTLLSGRQKEKELRRIARTAQIREEGRDAQMRYSLERFAAVTEGHRRSLSQFRERLLRAEEEEPALKARRQLLLHFTAVHFSNYLCAADNLRKGIHLVVIGGEDPLTEYNRAAAAVFAEMERDILEDVEEWMSRVRITPQGADLEEEGLLAPSSTWTYMIDESSSQFSRLPHIIRDVSNSMKGAWFTIPSLWEQIKKRVSLKERE